MLPWVPMAKGAVTLLPTDRSFSKLEALFSVQLDHNNGNEVSVLGMVRRWGWSRKRVRRLLDQIGVEISYPESTSKCQKQWGEIGVQKKDRKTEKRERDIFIDFNMLHDEGDRKTENEGQERDRRRPTTIEKENGKLKPTAFPGNAVGGNGTFYLTRKKRKLTGWKLEKFLDFWTAFNWKKGKAEASDAWLDTNLDSPLLEKVMPAATAEAKRRPGLIKNGGRPKWAEGWIRGRRWEDESFEEAKSNEPRPPHQRKLA